jgi:hypothetical protein
MPYTHQEFAEKIASFEQTLKNITESHTIDAYDEHKVFDYSNYLYPFETLDNYVFFITMKAQSRVKKKEGSLYGFVHQLVNKKLSDKTLEQQVTALLETPLEELLEDISSNIHLFHNKYFYILLKAEIHFSVLCLYFHPDNTCNAFIFDSIGAVSVSTRDVIKSMRSIFPKTKFFLYYSGGIVIDQAKPISFIEKIGAIQASRLGCDLISLEAIFNLSKIDFFPTLEKYFSENPLKAKKIFFPGFDGVTVIDAENIPSNMVKIFTSAQFSETYMQGIKQAGEMIISSKKLTIMQSTARRHHLGLQLFNHPSIQAKYPAEYWPNSYPKNDPLSRNWSIVYFKIRQLQKIIPWLKDPRNQLLFKKITEKCENIGDWVRIYEPENLRKIMMECGLLP